VSRARAATSAADRTATVPIAMSQPPAQEPMRRSTDPWAAVGRLSGGVLVYGGIGFAVDRWWDTTFMTPVGIMFGAALGIWTVYASLEQQ